MKAVSAKFQSRARRPVLEVDDCAGLKRSDWRRVLTTSKGAVTIEPHMPPRLRGEQVAVRRANVLTRLR